MTGRAPSGQPIGVFDSGVGGLTVLRALRSAMPGEDFIYLGDTARLPYGTKSDATVVRYSLQCAAALVGRGIRALVVACNTVSASSLDTLRQHYPALPIIGVIQPGAEAAVAASASKHIAVIGTEGTIRGGAYQRAIRQLDPAARVEAAACSLFVAMAEEGWTDGAIAESVARRYLEPIFDRGPSSPDTLVLGCTHFPVLAQAIRAVLPPQVRVVDSAVTTAAAVRGRLLQVRGETTPGETARPATARPATARAATARGETTRGETTPEVVSGTITWLATDGAARFARVGSIFLGEPLLAETVEIVDL